MKTKYIIILFILTVSTTGVTFAQDINQARKNFINGKFSKLITDLQDISSLEYAARIEARKLKAKSYIAIDSINAAKFEITQLLMLNYNFEIAYDDSPLFVEYVEEVKNEMAESLTSSVSKSAENIYETPATIVVITEDQIKNRGYQSIEELLYDVPGFDITRANGVTYSLAYQRGYRSTSTDRTLFLIDGVEENDLCSNIAYLSRQYPLTNIKRVEIIYGPASTMYGANAFAGVINVITKNSSSIINKRNSLGVVAEANFGSYNTRYADVTASAKYNNIALTVSGRFFLSDEMDLSEYTDWDYKLGDEEHYTENLTLTGSDAYDVASLYPKGSAERVYFTEQITSTDTTLTPTSTAITKAMASDEAAMSETIGGASIGFSNKTKNFGINAKLTISDFTLGFQTWKRNEGKIGWYNDSRAGSENGNVWIPNNTFIYLKYDKYLTNNLSISVFTRYKAHKLDDKTMSIKLSDYNHGSYDLASLLSGTKSSWNPYYLTRLSKQLRTEVRAVYKRDNFNIVGGVEYRNSLIQGNYLSSDESIPSETGIPGEIEGGNLYNQNDLGIFAQASLLPRFLPDMKLIVGSRYDYNQIRINGGYGWVFNPRFAMVYTPGDFIFKAIYGTAFLDASAFTKYATTTARQLSNPTLQPEEVQNFEITAYWKHSNFSVDIAAYRSDFSGVVSEVTVAYEGGYTNQFQPSGSLLIHGIQANAKYKSGNLTAYSNYTFTHPMNTEDDEKVRIADIASHQVNLGGNYIVTRGLNINLRMNLVGERETGEGTTITTNTTDKIKPYTVMFATVGYTNHKIMKGLLLQLIVNNILNNKYYHPGIRSANGSDYASYLPQNGRNFLIRLRYEY